MSANQTALPRPCSMSLCQESEEEDSNARDGKTTSKNGWTYDSLSHKSLPKIDYNGKLL